jgi:hypothetical protein
MDTLNWQFFFLIIIITKDLISFNNEKKPTRATKLYIDRVENSESTTFLIQSGRKSNQIISKPCCIPSLASVWATTLPSLLICPTWQFGKDLRTSFISDTIGPFRVQFWPELLIDLTTSKESPPNMIFK